jgi:hypothetical protein
MGEPTPPRALSRLDLPSAALHTRADVEPHPDSEAAVRYERQRFSQELGFVRGERDATRNDAHATPSLASLRSRNTLSGSSTYDSEEDLRRHNSHISGPSTHLDVHDDGDDGAGIDGTQQWYDAVASFWTAHISLSIDEGAHRDHLGTFPSLSALTQSDC